MFILYKLILGLCIPLNKNMFRQRVDINIACYENILDSNLSWREREMIFYKLSDLYYYKYVLDNVQNYKVNILPDDLLCYENTINGTENGAWYLFEEF
jgi:hypothetical protein